MCLTDNIRQIRDVLLSLLCQIAEKFDVDHRSLDGRERHIQHLKACRVRVLHIILQHLKVDFRLADNALFADLALAGLKLRLDHADADSVRRADGVCHREDMLERDERNVHAEERTRLCQVLRLYIADVRSFHIDDARIGA